MQPTIARIEFIKKKIEQNRERRTKYTPSDRAYRDMIKTNSLLHRILIELTKQAQAEGIL